jgi:fatty-acid desaturase
VTPVELLREQQESTKLAKKANAKKARRAAKARAPRRRLEPSAPKQSIYANGLEWPTTIWLTLLHVMAIGCIFFFTWKGVILTLALGAITGCIGITMGFHRCLTHGSFGTYPWVRRALAFIGGLAGEGPAIMWVATHRKHHEFSDHEGDPHSPREGFWWSHMLWLAPYQGSEKQRELHERYAPDLLKDKWIVFISNTFILWHFVLGFALFAVGYFCWDLYTAWSFVFYGMFLRLIYVLHGTWLVNSATHMWGYRNYETTDDSRNLWWVALITYGEGWHNNHHAHQRMARHGHRWWEVDVTYGVICLLEKCGLAWNVIRDIPHRHNRQPSA